MKIVVKIKNVYGNQAIYPVCANAKLFAAIAGTTTLTKPVINSIMQLGVAIELEQQPSIEEALGWFQPGGVLA